MSHIDPMNIKPGYLEGQLLVSTPYIKDNFFEETVVYIFAHGEKEGSVGVVINRPLRGISGEMILKELDINLEDVNLQKPKDFSVYFGGPLEAKRGIILHSSDFKSDLIHSTQVDDDIVITQDIQLLKKIASGNGPQQSMVVFGYAAWDAGQLESEIRDNCWFNVPSCNDLIFSNMSSREKWKNTAKIIGIDDVFKFSMMAGNA